MWLLQCTIHGHGGHIEQTHNVPCDRRLHLKPGENWPSGFREEVEQYHDVLNTVEFQWLEHLWDHGKFKTSVVRTAEG